MAHAAVLHSLQEFPSPSLLKPLCLFYLFYFSGGGPSQSVNTSTAQTGCNSTDVCGLNPCKNDGNCTDVWNAYTCSCAVGFSGVNCTLFGCSVKNNCLKNETCVDIKPGLTTCKCAYVFYLKERFPRVFRFLL